MIYSIYWAYKTWRDLATQFPAETISEDVEIKSKSSAMGLGNSATGSVDEQSGLLESSNVITSQPSESADKAKPEKSGSGFGAFLQKISPNRLASFRDSIPSIRALLLLVPLNPLRYYLFFTLALGIARMHPNKNSMVAQQPLLCSSLFLLGFVGLSSLAQLQAPYHLLMVVSAIPLAILQHWVNAYWISVEKPGLLTRHGFSFWELAAIITGALVIGFLASSIILNGGKLTPY